jgi:proprotein convertase subtilisin/kexin type 5
MGTNGNNCTNCKPECRTCSGKTTCDTCIIGYSLAPGGRCLIKCGDKNREDNEECDDGNIEDGDGCSSDCKVEPGFVCMPLDTTTLGPDLCFCDAQPQSASWTEFWG